MFDHDRVDSAVRDGSKLNYVERYAVACRLLASSIEELRADGRLQQRIVQIDLDMGEGQRLSGLVGVGVDAPLVKAVTEHVAARNPFISKRSLMVDRPKLSQRVANFFNRR